MKGTVNNITTGYVGLHYEVVNGVARNYYLAGSQRVAVREGDGTRSYLISDHLGSTAVTANASGIGTAELRYSPWGQTRFSSGMTPTTHRYTGQRQEQDFGLYYYGARWYDPQLGRFIQPDTIVPDPTDYRAFDRYA